MKTIPVASFNTRSQAEALRNRLAASGIRAEIHDELRYARLWFVSRPKSGVRLEVPLTQTERAHQLLIDWQVAEGAFGQAIHCPECGSLRVEYPQYTEKSLLTNLAMGLAAELRLFAREYYCEDCHYTWPKEGSKGSRLRPHMAPYYFIEGIEDASASGLREEARRKAA